jgi:hypothetical protein
MLAAIAVRNAADMVQKSLGIVNGTRRLGERGADFLTFHRREL